MKQNKPYEVGVCKMPNCDHLYEASNKIHQWYTVQRSIDDLSTRLERLKAELAYTETELANRKKLLHSLRCGAISCTDPIQQYIEATNEASDSGEDG